MSENIQVIIGKKAGFCYGVNNAVTKTLEVLKIEEEKNVYCLGELVHNKQVVEKLEKNGLVVVETVEEIKAQKNCKVIIRAHGVPPEVYKKLEENNCEIMDLTCPNVLAIHKIAEQFSEKDYYTFLIGKSIHPETIGTFGFCKSASIIENEEDIKKALCDFKNSKKLNILIIAQTTISLTKFNELVEILKQEIDLLNSRNENVDKINLEIRNTICNATKIRQEETDKISKTVDYMIIVGGKNSSNTKKLYEIAIKNCKSSICVETADELPLDEIKKCANNKGEVFNIGIMAGASTPQESIDEVKEVLLK